MRPGGHGRQASQRRVRAARRRTRATSAWTVDAAGLEVYPMSHIRNTKNLETSSESQASSAKLGKIQAASLKPQAASLKLQAASDKLHDPRTLIKFHGTRTTVLR